MNEEQKKKIGDNLVWQGEDMDDETDKAWAKKIMADVRKKLPNLFKK